MTYVSIQAIAKFNYLFLFKSASNMDVSGIMKNLVDSTNIVTSLASYIQALNSIQHMKVFHKHYRSRCHGRGCLFTNIIAYKSWLTTITPTERQESCPQIVNKPKVISVFTAPIYLKPKTANLSQFASEMVINSVFIPGFIFCALNISLANQPNHD